MIFFSCTSVKDSSKSQDDSREFFDPSKTVAAKRDSRPLERKISEKPADRSDVRPDSVVNDKVMAENDRLVNILGQMKNADGQLWKETDALNGLERSAAAMTEKRSLASNLELIELLKDQNARLIDVLEQLKTIVSQQKSVTRIAEQKRRTGREADSSADIPMLDVKLAYSRAMQSYHNHRYARAIAQFWQIVASKPSRELSNGSRFWLGVSYFNLQRYGDAIPLFKRLLSVQRFEKKEATYIMLGQCYEQIGDRPLARTTFEELLRINPTSDMAQVAQLKMSML